MPTGTVKWFNNAKGFGFILPDEGNEDVFAHYSAIKMEGYRTLKAGQAVEFDVSQGDKGLHAVNICVITTETVAKPEASAIDADASSGAQPTSGPESETKAIVAETEGA